MPTTLFPKGGIEVDTMHDLNQWAGTPCSVRYNQYLALEALLDSGFYISDLYCKWMTLRHWKSLINTLSNASTAQTVARIVPTPSKLLNLSRILLVLLGMVYSMLISFSILGTQRVNHDGNTMRTSKKITAIRLFFFWRGFTQCLLVFLETDKPGSGIMIYD